MTESNFRTAARRVRAAPLRSLESVGAQASFYGRAYAATPWSLRRYRKEVLRQLAKVTFGSGNLAGIGGTAVVMAITLVAAGTEGTQLLYKSLQLVGVQVYTGFIAGYADIRIVLPVITSVTLVATVGAGFTADIGARRISEEIDALEVMAVRPIPFLVSTRIIAGAIAIVPLFAISMIAMFSASYLRTVLFEGLASGSYNQYFSAFLREGDIGIAFLETLIAVVAVMSIHTYYGYSASGGPAGVGEAVGRSVRLSLIVVLFLALAASILLYGNSDTLHLSR